MTPELAFDPLDFPPHRCPDPECGGDWMVLEGKPPYTCHGCGRELSPPDEAEVEAYFKALEEYEKGRRQ